MKNSLKTSLTLVAVATLSACGGGGGDSEPTTPAGFSTCSIDVAAYGAALGVAVSTGTSVSVTSSLSCADLDKSLKASLAASTAELQRLQQAAASANARVAAAVLAGQQAVDAKQVQLNAANLRAAQAEKVAADAAVALQQAVVARNAAQALAAQAKIDLDAAKTDAAKNAALALAAQADAAKAKAAQAIAEAAAAKATADKVAAEAATATAKAQIVTLNAQIVVLQAQVAAGGGDTTALNAQIKKLQDDLAAAVLNTQTQVAALQVQLTAANTALTAANADKTALTAQIASLNAQVASLQAQLAAAGNGGNNTGLPFCVGNPNPIVATTTFPGAGTACVISYADQKALADAIAANGVAVKLDGIYFSDTLFMVAETDGKVWILDQKTPSATFGAVNVPASTGTTFSAPSTSLGANPRPTVAVAGNYVKKTSATFSMAYTPGATVQQTGLYDPAFDTALVMPVKKMAGSDFYTGSTDVEMTVAGAGATFTGREGTCTFSGTFGATTKGYNKVTITWGANCAVPTGTIGSGMVALYGDNFIMMTNQTVTSGPAAGLDVGFTAFFNNKTVAPLSLKTDSAKALQASLAGAR